MNSSSAQEVSTQLLHHGAAANSNAHVVLWVARKDDERGGTTIHSTTTTTPTTTTSELVYASHSILNLTRLVQVSLSSSSSSTEEKDQTNHQQNVWHVYQTLRTQTIPRFGVAEQRRIITSLASLPLFDVSSVSLSSYCYGLACGFSDGTIVVWIPSNQKVNEKEQEGANTHHDNWEEHVIVGSVSTNNNNNNNNSAPYTAPTDEAGASITNMDGLLVQNGNRRDVWLVTCTCDGSFFYHSPILLPSEQPMRPEEKNIASDHHHTEDSVSPPRSPQTILPSAMNTVQIHFSLGHMYILLGTAAPRHNKIWVYTIDVMANATTPQSKVEANTADPALRCWGYLVGHEDWITSLAWSNQSLCDDGRDDDDDDWTTATSTVLLASASQDARIRLWKFSSSVATTVLSRNRLLTTDTPVITPVLDKVNDGLVDDDPEDDDDDDDDDEEQEGEARLEIGISDGTFSAITRVTLEALLIGHEGPVTSVQWHPRATPLYGVEHILLSSSMDRSLFLWACTGTTTNHANVWTPLTRVGSAGGILGGSIGSSLLGFVQARLEPVHGKSLVGHAYGGALHIWSLQDLAANNNGDNITDPVSTSDAAAMEDIAQLRKWEATSCVTGHFAGVADLCWEAELGAYLLTVSIDQTCRLWALVSGKNTANESESVWVELARPQVHGYDLTAIASLSTSVHRHLMASGADEKEIRIYDAPMTTIRTLRACCQQGVRSAEDNVTRVERAYIPSLGLSNKVSAADGAEEDSGETDSSTATRFQLPLERDLGAVSLWPEVRKLFGHTTETYCLASTVGARTGLLSFATSPFANDVLLASSAKARDVEAANIRIWDVQEGKCMQVLEGGHKSTVATMSFSPDGKLLASSGKDRRLCIWRRSENDTSDGSSSHKQLFHLAAAIDSAHKRIIWGVHFCPFNPLLLASGSRDGVVKLWQISENESDPLQVDSKESFGPNTKIDKKKSDAVTALSFAPIPFYNHAVLALGLECGQIELWNISLSPEAPLRPTFLYCIPPNQCHVASVTTLAWKPHRQPTSEDDDSVALVLASSAMDHGCRIIKVIISK